MFIGPKFLNAGPGFGGSCFQKDILNPFISPAFRPAGGGGLLGERGGVEHLATAPHCPFGSAEAVRHGDGEALAVLGFAFKADTNDTREAPAIRICRDLPRGAQLVIHDPKVAPNQMARDLNQEPTQVDLLSGTGSWASRSVEDAVMGADAMLILTEWQHYRDLNWQALAARMRKPAWVFDARAVAILPRSEPLA